MKTPKRWFEVGEEQLKQFLNMPRECQKMFFFYIYKQCQMYSADDFGYINEACDSPIEKMFLYAFKIITSEIGRYFDWIETQVPIEANGKRYIADFVIDSEHTPDQQYIGIVKLVVECDGHEYHKSTKEQVKHDNERDYNMKLAGYEVLRFSGSEIYSNPFACAIKVIEFIDKKTNRRGGLHESS